MAAAALRDLLVLDAADTPAHEDMAVATARAGTVAAELVARRIWAAGDPDAIGDDCFEPFVAVVVEHLRAQFGGQDNPQARADAEGRLARIDRLSRGGTPGLAAAVLERLESLGLSTEALDATAIGAIVPQVLADLAARRIAAIAAEGAMSAAQRPHIVTLVAARAQPKAYDAAAIALVEGQLAELTRRDRTPASGLAKAVLERLDAAGAGTAAIDYAAVAGAVQGVLDELAARRIVAIADEAAVSGAQTPALVTLIAARMLPRAVDPAAVQAAEQALSDIARLDRSVATALVRGILGRLRLSYPQALAVADAQFVADAMQDILDDLSARLENVYIPDVDSVPQGWTAELTRFAAASIAGDRDGMAASERQFKLMAAKAPSLLPLEDPDGDRADPGGHFWDYR
ncbi:hypothetical protein GCM10010994_16580 [Chelatococcus reniformis]|uniref:Uncharacterized protein n=1 Tax=Chelatococcus reniformis TaxID=1494448 RepID=A0A916U3W5_9HYPH|nr:hypothetical protein GCM10010994_16580 [Chelatococcus reniformis]